MISFTTGNCTLWSTVGTYFLSERLRLSQLAFNTSVESGGFYIFRILISLLPVHKFINNQMSALIFLPFCENFCTEFWHLLLKNFTACFSQPSLQNVRNYTTEKVLMTTSVRTCVRFWARWFRRYGESRCPHLLRLKMLPSVGLHVYFNYRNNYSVYTKPNVTFPTIFKSHS